MQIDASFNLRHLHMVAEITRWRSLRRAAAEVHLSQPAMTQALAQLELQLGQRLFERTGGGMVPTAATLALSERIDRAFAWLRATKLHRKATRIQLQCLVAAIDAESVSMAARRLGMRQPSVTRALRDLETLCGKPLFARSPQGIDATREARELARLAGLALADIRQGVEAFREHHGKIDGQIVVGCLPLARSAILPTAVTRLLKRYPELSLRIVDGPYPELLHELRSGRLDLLIGALRSSSPADIRQEELFRDRLSIVVRPGHPLLDRRLTPPDFAGLGWVLPPDGTPARELFHGFFREMGLEEPAHVVVCSSLVAIRGLLLQSDRAALLSTAQVGYELGAGQLKLLAGPLDETARPIGLALRADWRPTLAQEHLMALIRQCAVA